MKRAAIGIIWLTGWCSQALFAQNLQGLKNQKPVTFSGGINAGINFYEAQNAAERQAPFAWNISASPTIGFYGILFPFTFVYADNNRSLSTPFQRFGVSPFYKWVKIHLGYRSLNFNPFVFSGQPMLGAGVELNPKWFRFGFMKGRMAKAQFIDSSRANFAGQPSIFSRNGYAVKIGFGSEKNHIDFLFLKAADDVASLPASALNSSTVPAENSVIGISVHRMFSKKLEWKMDFAASAYTRDTRSDVIVVPTSDPFLKFITGLFEPHISSQVYAAGESSLRFLFGSSSLNLSARYVQPDYKSMGTFYFENDLFRVTVGPNLIFKTGKIIVAGNIGIEHDNLTHLKMLTDKKVIGNLNLSVRPTTSISSTLQYSNYGISQVRFSRLAEDSATLRLVNQNLGWNLQKMWQKKIALHIFSVNTNWQNTDDAGFNANGTGNVNSLFGSFTYTLNLTKKQFSVFGGLNASKAKIGNTVSSNTSGFTFGFGKGFLKNKINCRASSSVFSQSDQNNQKIITENSRLGFTLRLDKYQTLQLNTNLLHSSNGRQEWTGSVNYSLGF